MLLPNSILFAKQDKFISDVCTWLATCLGQEVVSSSVDISSTPPNGWQCPSRRPSPWLRGWVHQTSGESSYKVSSFKEYKIGKSKAIIDRIDDLICPLYGLTQEEAHFIKNYEIEFRLSDEE